MIFHIIKSRNEYIVGNHIYPLDKIADTIWEACVKKGIEKKAKEFVTLIWGRYRPDVEDGLFPEIEPKVPNYLNKDFTKLNEVQQQEYALKCVKAGEQQFVDEINRFLGLDRLINRII